MTTIEEILVDHAALYDYDVSYLGPARCSCGYEVQGTNEDRDEDHARHVAEHLRATEAAPEPAIDAQHLRRQAAWSRLTFGPGPRVAGILAHIRKELEEVEANPTDLTEWADVVILALDGAWRAGGEPQQIIDTIRAKQTENEARTWPDWRTADPDAPIEHVDDHQQEVERAPGEDRCVCDPAGPCLGVPGESDACDACLVLDPEEACLHDPSWSPVCEHEWLVRPESDTAYCLVCGGER